MHLTPRFDTAAELMVDQGMYFYNKSIIEERLTASFQLPHYTLIIANSRLLLQL
jgi:hypothetical protein